MRRRIEALAMRRCFPAPTFVPLCVPARAGSFADFGRALWPGAHAKGISRATFETALRGVTPDARVIAATKRQPEYGKPVGDYINALVGHGRIERGRVKAREWGK